MKAYAVAISDFATRMHDLYGVDNWRSSANLACVDGMAFVFDVPMGKVVRDINKAVKALVEKTSADNADDDGSCFYASDEILGRVYDGYSACDY